MELEQERKTLINFKIQRGVFQRDSLLPQVFVIEIMPRNFILKKCTGSYELREKINHLMYMNDIRIFTKNEKELKSLIERMEIYNQNIGMKFGIEKCAMF